MATKKQPQPPLGARSFKKSGEGFYPLAAGDEVEGRFLRRRNVSIVDRTTRQRKDINAYDLELSDGEKISISGRALLDDAFNDIFNELGGEDKLRGKQITIKRLEDVETATTEQTGNMMGTYEILVWGMI